MQLQAGVAEGLVLLVSGEDGSKFIGQFAVTFALCKCVSALRCCDGIVESTGFGVGRSQGPMQNRADAAGEFQRAFRQLDRASSVAERGVRRSGEHPCQVALRISVIRI